MKRIRQIPAMRGLKLFVSLAFITCLFQSQAAFAQTLRPSANGRYIEWSNGTPAFLLSDTCWMLGPSYTQTEVVNHVNTRKAQGFAAIQMSAVMPSLHPLTDAFTSGDFSRPVASYWTALDAKVKTITDAGLVVFITPYWLRSGSTFTSEKALNANSDAKCLAYGRFFGTRYRNNPRVLYFLGGDAFPTRGVDNTSRIDNMGRGIDQVYAEAGLPKPIITYHNNPGRASRETYNGASWLNLNWTYDYSPPLSDNSTAYSDNWAEWQRSPAMPVMHGEGWYDRDNGATQTSRWNTRHGLRRQIWWSVLSGSIAGHAYGAEPIWLDGYNGITPAQAATWNSGLDAARVKKFLDTVEWWKLQPDIASTFMTGPNSPTVSNERAVAALANDNTFGLGYTPVARSLTFRLPSSGFTYTLRWYDPSNGTYRSGSVAGASGASVTLAHPGNNASGSPDWVVHITSSGGGNNSPEVSLSAPANGATFTAGANITISANASDSDGTVTQVAFYRGTTLIGTDTTSPYSVTWNGAATGSYSLTAIATDNDGATQTSSAVSITVGDAPPPGGVIQAESAVLAGGVTVDTNNAGYNGSGFLNFPTTGGTAQFNGIDGGTTGGAATLTIRFANGASAGARTGQLVVNGATQNITFASTGAWTTWVDMTVNINLVVGTANSIRFASTGQDLGNIDQITVTVGGGTPPPPPPPPPPPGVVLNGTFKIINQNSQKSVDAFGGRVADGTAIIQYTYSGSNNQRWTVADRGSAQHSIIGVASGKALNVIGAGTNNAKLELRTYTGATNQKWTFTTVGSNYRVTPVHATGTGMEVEGASLSNGALVQIATYTGATSQLWSISAP